MATNQKKITDSMRACWTAELMAHIANNHDTDVCQTAAGTFMFPVVDAAGEDRWVKVSVIIPKDADEENGNDGYSLAKEYQLKLKAAEDRKLEAEKKAQERAAKAKAKAEKASTDSNEEVN